MEWTFGPKHSKCPEVKDDRWGPRHPGVPGPSMSEWQARAELLFAMVEELLGDGPDRWGPDVNGDFSVGIGSGCAWCGGFGGDNPNKIVYGGRIHVALCPWARWRHFLTGSTQG